MMSIKWEEEGSRETITASPLYICAGKRGEVFGRRQVYFHFVRIKLIARERGGGGLINGRHNSSGSVVFPIGIVSDYGSAGSGVNVLRLARSRDKPPEQTEPRKSRAALLTRAAPETNLPRAAASFVD